MRISDCGMGGAAARRGFSVLECRFAIGRIDEVRGDRLLISECGLRNGREPSGADFRFWNADLRLGGAAAWGSLDERGGERERENAGQLYYCN
jgi:hypothetical protein